MAPVWLHAAVVWGWEKVNHPKRASSLADIGNIGFLLLLSTVPGKNLRRALPPALTVSFAPGTKVIKIRLCFLLILFRSYGAAAKGHIPMHVTRSLVKILFTLFTAYTRDNLVGDFLKRCSMGNQTLCLGFAVSELGFPVSNRIQLSHHPSSFKGARTASRETDRKTH